MGTLQEMAPGESYAINLVSSSELLYPTSDEGVVWPIVGALVHVYDGEHDILYEDVGSLQYATQTMMGQPADPVMLELSLAGQAPQLLEVPDEFALHGDYPNPFNPTTIIAYDSPEAVNVNLTVFDVLGRRVVTLVDGENRAGRHKVNFDARSLASGFYLYRLQAGDFVKVHKMILAKKAGSRSFVVDESPQSAPVP